MNAADIISRAKRDAEDAQRVASDPRPWASHIRLLDAALAAVPGWRPIETAPKDGTEVLAWQPSPDGGHLTVAGFDGPDGPWWSETGLRLNPSHWMPLPEPPSL